MAVVFVRRKIIQRNIINTGEKPNLAQDLEARFESKKHARRVTKRVGK